MANELSNLAPNSGATRNRTRVGRGEGSGKGKTCGKGTKGAKTRSGYVHRAGFEGGQMPLHRRLPKRGFNNPFGDDFEVVNLAKFSDLAAGSVVTAQTLKSANIISRIVADGVKVLSIGEVTNALHVRVAKISAAAAKKIVAAGGTVEGDLPNDS